jgi:HPt (histidine-containing phosphotransfer) domain-containing protein
VTPDEEFTERLARVRQRFAAALDGKIGDSFVALEQMSGGGDTAETVITTHRRLHELCGAAPTLGFPATGKAARSAESVLRGAVKSKRPLTRTEIAALKAKLDALRQAAAGELQAYSNRP